MIKTISAIKFFKLANKDPHLVYPIVGESEQAIKMKLPFIKKAIWYLTSPADVKYILKSPDYIRDPHAIVAVRDLLEGGIDVPHDFLPDDAEALKKMFTEEHEKELTAGIIKSIQKRLDILEEFADAGKTINLELEVTSLFVQMYLDSFLSGISMNRSVSETGIFINHSFNSFFFLNYTFQSLAKIRSPFTRSLRLYVELKKQATELGFEFLEKSMRQQSTDFNIVRYLASYFNYPADLDQWDINMKRHIAGRAFATMVSSTHNSAGSMAHTLVTLSTQPTIRKKIAEEVSNIVGDRIPTYEDINKLVYTRAVVLESTRLNPPVLNHFRISKIDDNTIPNVSIKKGDIIIIPVFICQRLSKYWKNPEGFEPERFMQPLTEVQKDLYLSFSYGPQGCIAKRFSLLEATIFLAMLSQRYHFDLIAGTSLDFDPNLLFFSARVHPDLLMNVRTV